MFIINIKQIQILKRYKAGLVIKGYARTYEIDNQETFVLVGENIIHLLLSFTTSSD